MSYQSEAALENNLINILSKNGYEKVSINNEEDLINNFRKQLSIFNQDKLKGQPLTDKEFQRIMNRIQGKSIFQSSKILRDKLEIERDNGEKLFLTIMDTKSGAKTYFK